MQVGVTQLKALTKMDKLFKNETTKPPLKIPTPRVTVEKVSTTKANKDRSHKRQREKQSQT